MKAWLTDKGALCAGRCGTWRCRCSGCASTCATSTRPAFACLAGGVPCPAGGGSQRQPWVAVGKHLCGAAADFALLCVAQAATAGSWEKDIEDGFLQGGQDCRAAGAGSQSERACCGARGVPDSTRGPGCSDSGEAVAPFISHPATILCCAMYH